MRVRYKDKKTRHKIHFDRGFFRIGDEVKIRERHEAVAYMNRAQLKAKETVKIIVPRKMVATILSFVEIRQYVPAFDWTAHVDFNVWLKATWRKKKIIFIKTALRNLKLKRLKKVMVTQEEGSHEHAEITHNKITEVTRYQRESGEIAEDRIPVADQDLAPV